jgi:hypothetical protein
LQLWKNYSFHQLLFSVYSYANLIYDHHKVSLSVSVILKKVLLDLYVTDPCRYFLHRYFFFIVVYYQIATFIWLYTLVLVEYRWIFLLNIKYQKLSKIAQKV